MLFFNMTMMGTLVSISSFSWFSMWIGLEINLLSVIPLFKSHKNMMAAEATLKYFITQALASAIILFSIILTMNMNEFINNNYNYWILMIMNSALLTKMGAAPFHSWFPEVAEGLNWMNNLILLTWQKLAPMILIMYNLNMTLFFSFIIMISAIISGVWGINQMSLRKILAYSSINHIAWMLASMMNVKMIWFMYFSIYSIISMNIILIFYLFNIFYMMQLFNSLNSSKLVKIMFILNFLSLGGLPPFLGFLPKWLTINFLTMNYFYFLSFILIVFTLLTLFFYIRIAISSLTIYMNESLAMKSYIYNTLILIFNSISIMMLIVCTNMFNIF
uniref:NADH-ubiquinone oxidoreductase chain 2 n=1 Tax=Neocrepidodera brevicollis TaxID=1425586 RepID=A0A3G1GQI4_9CUCU|nr:NADH dehydrogenase subunit 2 [Neocrepidodera brevicollis]